MAKQEKNPKEAPPKSTKTPQSKAADNKELSDADLQAAAGGMASKIQQNLAQKEILRKAQKALE